MPEFLSSSDALGLSYAPVLQFSSCLWFLARSDSRTHHVFVFRGYGGLHLPVSLDATRLSYTHTLQFSFCRSCSDSDTHRRFEFSSCRSCLLTHSDIPTFEFSSCRSCLLTRSDSDTTDVCVLILPKLSFHAFGL